MFSEDGQYLHHFGQSGKGKGELSGPQGLCVSGEYVYITQWGNNRVSMFHTSGEFVHSFGKGGSGGGELKYPHGIAIDQDGFVQFVIKAIIIYRCFKYHHKSTGVWFRYHACLYIPYTRVNKRIRLFPKLQGNMRLIMKAKN